jgi:hypothetical protein
MAEDSRAVAIPLPAWRGKRDDTDAAKVFQEGQTKFDKYE